MNEHPSPAKPGIVERYIGMRLAIRRRDLGLSPDAVDTGILAAAGTTEKIEAGATFIGLDQLQALALALDVTISYFFEGIADDGNAPPSLAPKGSSTDEAQKLINAYFKISNGKTRSSLLSLLKSVADETP